MDGLDASVVVAHQALAGAQLEQRAPQALVAGVEAEQAEGAASLGVRAHAEHEGGADEVVERLAVERVGHQLGADDGDGELGAPHTLQRGEQQPSGGVGQQSPALVEGEDLQALAFGGHEVHGEERQQPHDLLGDALGLRVVGARRPRLGGGQVAQRDVGDLAGADLGQGLVGAGEAQAA